MRDVAPEPYRAAQIAKWIYERRAASFSEMTNLPKAMREALAREFTIGLPKIVTRTAVPDGTEKFLFELADGARVEAVYIVESKKKPSWTDPDTPEAARITICLSSQAGCAVDCAFCVTGRMGAGRNLTAGEIVGQYLVLAKERGFGPHEANVVFMGMGEPLLNVGNVKRALDLLEDEVSPRRTTVSTAGVVPGIESLAARPRRPNLAVSLSARGRRDADEAHADQPDAPDRGALRGAQALAARARPEDHVRVGPHRGRERPARGRLEARGSRAAPAVEGEPDPAERIGGVAARA